MFAKRVSLFQRTPWGREVPQESSQCYMSPSRDRDITLEFSLCKRALKYSLGPITVGFCALLNI